MGLLRVTIFKEFLKSAGSTTFTHSWKQLRAFSPLFLCFACSHLWPFAVRTPTVERQEEAAAGNQDPFGIRAIQAARSPLVGWLINRTFPLLNLRRREALMGLVAWPAVHWPTRQSAEGTFPSSFPSSPASSRWQHIHTHTLSVLLPAPSHLSWPLSVYFLPPSVQGRLLWPPLSYSRVTGGRDTVILAWSLGCLPSTFLHELPVQHRCVACLMIALPWVVPREASCVFTVPGGPGAGDREEKEQLVLQW